ncbi:hypothetical protein CYMTET_25124 [Cymbomonas tetramitiformis]|uniref:TRUD domain-containing protein n=1 Tax=Cymbomonas tetramitiformis TaxID=36881 RepID=A0AAE0KZH9_9CHLO|nr:hypothetical protein CYMTET_25124 [Cymbomonas tetramitiformis]
MSSGGKPLAGHGVTAFRLEVNKLLGLNKFLKNALVGNISHVDTPAKLGDLSGNRFEIVLRNVAAPEEQVLAACEQLQVRLLRSRAEVAPEVAEQAEGGRGAQVAEQAEGGGMGSPCIVSHVAVELRSRDGGGTAVDLTSRGFVNYFGLQRFGTAAAPTHSIGLAILKSDWAKAVDLIMCPRDGEKPEAEKARALFAKNKDAHAALRMMPVWMNVERTILEGYKRHGKSGHHNALQGVARNMRLMYVHAYQSYVWNAMVSERFKLFGTEQAVEGDLVLIGGAEESAVEDAAAVGVADDSPDTPEGGWTARHPKQVRVLTAEEAVTCSLSDVVLPMPGISVTYPTNAIGELYRERLKADGLDLDNLKHSVKDYSLQGDYRKIVGRPEDCEWDMLAYRSDKANLQLTDRDRLSGLSEDYIRSAAMSGGEDEPEQKALRLRFTLRSSQYATMCIRELLKGHMENATLGPGAQNSSVSAQTVTTAVQDEPAPPTVPPSDDAAAVSQ